LVHPGQPAALIGRPAEACVQHRDGQLQQNQQWDQQSSRDSSMLQLVWLQAWLLRPLIASMLLHVAAAGMVLGAASRLSQAGRSGLLVECNNKKGLGVTLYGTRR
jgi:hypothetical protein